MEFEQDFENLIDTLNRAEAMRLLEDIQMQAVRGGLNSMTMDDIDKEVALYRRRLPLTAADAEQLP